MSISNISIGREMRAYMQRCPAVTEQKLGCGAEGRARNHSLSRSHRRTCLAVPTQDICGCGGQTNAVNECSCACFPRPVPSGAAARVLLSWTHLDTWEWRV